VALTAALVATVLAQAGTPAPTREPGPLAVRAAMVACTGQVREVGVDACRRAIALGLDDEHAAIAYSVLATDLADLERWDEAAEACRQLVRLRPTSAVARWRLGDALLFGLGQAQEAEAVLREAVRLDPSRADSHASLAAALNALGRHGESVAEMEEARRLEPRLFDTRPASHEVYRAALAGKRWPE
jgi:tetratricopeptide (TPR) repeat protein